MSDTIPCLHWEVPGENPQSGYIDTPWYDDWDTQFWATLHDAGCEPAFRRDFLVTDSPWFGLWIQSPLSTSQCAILATIFRKLATVFSREKAAYEAFADAMSSAAQRGLPVTVTLSPPGHVDFGWRTIYPHCPRCKTEAPVERWQKPYPDTLLDCPVCEYKFSPAATHSSERIFWSSTVKCERCDRQVVVRDLPEPDRDLLEDLASFKRMQDELQWLHRVRDFYQRHPDQKDAIKSDFDILLKPGSDQILNQLKAGVPFHQIVPPQNNPPNDREWSTEDREVISYLKQSSLNFDARYSFVSDFVRSGSDKFLNQQASCPHCGGRLG